MKYSLTLLTAAALVACGPERESRPATDSASSTLQLNEYGFVIRGRGFAEGSHAQTYTSAATGAFEIVMLDDPAVIVGSLTVERMQLRAGQRVLATLGPGDWPFLARRTATGTIDAVWTAPETPPEVQRLLRFMLAELQVSADSPAVEQTPTGPIDAHYHRFTGLGVPTMTTRARMRAQRGDVAHGWTLFFGGAAEPLVVASGLVTQSSLLGEDQLISGNFVLARRTAVTPADDEKLAKLRLQIEELSQHRPVDLVEPPQTEEQRAAQRRAAEPWEEIRRRLVDNGPDIDTTSLSRAAAHLAADDALVADLLELAGDPSAIHTALGECGTPACQAGLVAATADEGLAAEDLAAFTRIHEPTLETADYLVALAVDGDAMTRSAVGVVLSHLGEANPEAASERVEWLIGDMEGCDPNLDSWFGLLGNAGLPVTKTISMACLEQHVASKRRAAAAGALRRVPGPDVTAVLVGLSAEDPDERVRLACLRALAVRDVADAELATIVAANIEDWQLPALHALLDVLARVKSPGQSTSNLRQRLAASNSEEIAERAKSMGLEEE